MPPEEAWVDVEAVAAHLGVAKQSVYRWVDGKGFPAHRVGRLLRFKLSEVDAWIQMGHAQNERDAESGTASRRGRSK